MDRLKPYFSFQGRANRARYWLTQLGAWGFIVVSLLTVTMVAGAVPLLYLVFLPVIVAFVWVVMANGARRLHDRNKSAWWLLLFMGVPALLGGIGALAGAGGSPEGQGAMSVLSLPISIWAFVELGCLRGTEGPNRFGDDPLQPPRLAQTFA